MKKVLILFGVVIILLLSSCTNSEPVSRVELSEEDIAALRMEYPYCDTSNIMADIEILGIVDQLKAEVSNYTWGLAEVEITSTSTNSESSYQINDDSPEMALNMKVGGNGVQKVKYVSWMAELRKDILGNIPDRLVNSEGEITLYKTSVFASKLPDFQVGDKYIVVVAMLPEDSSARQDKVNECEAVVALYLTDDDYLISTFAEHDEFSGLPLERFIDNIESEFANPDNY